MIGRHGILPRTLPTPAPWRAARFRHPRRPLPDPCRSTVPLRFPPRARSIKVDLPLNQISYLSPHRYQVPVVSRGTASARRSTSCCGRPRSIGRPKFCAGVRLSLLRYFTTFIEVIWEEVVSSTLQMENLGRAKMLACRPGTIQRSESEELPLLVAKTSLTQDGVNHRNRNVARVHWDRSTPRPSGCTYRAWLPRCRRNTNPARSNLRMRSRARSGLSGMGGEIHAEKESFLPLAIRGKRLPLP